MKMVFIKGRIKEVINRGGAKISSQEVDELLQRHPAVKQAITFPVPHLTLGEDIAVAVVLHDGQVASMQELRQFAAASLADFKVPRQIVFVKEIPKNAIGKIQRIGMAEKLNAELEALRTRETGAETGPSNEIEAIVQTIWQEVLGIEHVGVHEDYLVMGGDSIRAAIILMNVNERFGTELSIGDIFDTPTVATMAGAIQTKLDTARPNLAFPPIQRRDLSEAILSPAQEGLWVIQQFSQKTVAYNYCFLFKLTGGVEPQVMEQALNEMALRHESLRMIYTRRDGELIQMRLPFEKISLPVIDFSTLPENERLRAIHHYAAEIESRPFDLEKESAGRYALLHASSNEDYLCFCTHHINWDAWSHFVFTADLMKLYEACRAGEKPDLPGMPVQYTDYAIALDEWLQGETRAAYVTHWADILKGELPALELPTDHPRPAMQTDHGARYRVCLPSALSAQIKEFCRHEHMMPFHLLVAAYALLLGRYSNQEDVIFGCPFSNRPRPELGGLIGLFTNVLPLRLNLSGNPAVRELFQQARSVMLDAFTWQALPFQTLVAKLAPQRDMSRTPIYQVAINMMNVPRRSTSIPGLELSDVHRDEMPAQFDLDFEFTDEGDFYSISVIFNTDLFEKTTIVRMALHFQNILEKMLAAPDRPISDVEMLSAAEYRQALVGWNATKRGFPRDKNIYRLFEEQVMKTPDALAVIFGNDKATYLELNRGANRLAHYLVHLGVGEGTFVGVYMERSLDMVKAMLAILKIGGAYVPLDPTYPLERLKYMVKDSGINVIVSEENWARSLYPELDEDIRIVSLDTQSDVLARQSDENLIVNVEPEAVAYVIYTSGSTGVPKGICVPHRAIIRLVRNTNYITLTNEDRIAQASNMSFDAATFEVWGALLNGAQLIGIPKEVILSPEDLAMTIEEQKIDVLFLTTSLFNQVASIQPRAFATLRDMLFGGEAVTSFWVRTILQAGAPQRLLHMYGPTESTTYATWHLIKEVADTDLTVPIGVPIANTTAYVLDEYQHIVPVGVNGELYIGGEGLAVGYHNRPNLTSERFIQNPFQQEEEKADVPSSDRLYRTGDLVRRKPDGNIEFLGRLDHQVKLRGFRIELGEIESVLKQHPGVHDVMVIMREDQPGDKRLAGYIVPETGVTLENNILQEFLRDRLPEYMVPSGFVFLESFPITPNGKIDRKALPVPRQDDGVGQGLEALHTTTENRLAKIWMNVLRLSGVGRMDNFFDIGGNSLSALQLMGRIQKEFELKLPLSILFKFPCLADLATRLDLELQKKDQRLDDREAFVL